MATKPRITPAARDNMRSFFTDPLGFTADLFKHLYRERTHLTVRDPEGHCIYTHWHESWETALDTLRYMLPGAVNDLTHKPIS